MQPRDPNRIRVVSGVRLRIEKGILEIWLAKRSGGRWYQDCWETAGGKVEAGESDAQALIREWDEETGYKIVLGDLGAAPPLYVAEFVTPEGRVYDFVAYEVAVFNGEERLTAHSEGRWFPVVDALLLDRTTPSLRPLLRVLADRVRNYENEVERLDAVLVPARGKHTWRWECFGDDVWFKHLVVLAKNEGAITRISVDGEDCPLTGSRIPLSILGPTVPHFGPRHPLFANGVRRFVGKGSVVEIVVENDETSPAPNNAMMILDRIVPPWSLR